MSLLKELGIDATTDGDLLWVAAKCKSAKPSPVASWNPRSYYAALVANASAPDWPLSAAEAEPLLRNGWYRATSVAAFAAHNAKELTTKAQELLIVNGDQPAPDGWLTAARASNPSVAGLVPTGFLMGTVVAVVAAADYDGVGKGGLSFKSGDALLMRPGSLPAQAWWLGRAGGERGYLPRYLLDPSWRVRGRLAVGVIWAQYKLHRSRAGESKLGDAAKRAGAATMIVKIIRGRLARQRLEAIRQAPQDYSRKEVKEALGSVAEKEAVQARLRLQTAERECAKAIGLDLNNDSDLEWIVKRALAAKPAWPDPLATARARALATAATGAEWKANPDKVMNNGWFRATALAGFSAEAKTELSIRTSESLYVSSENFSTEAWCFAAQERDVEVRGLVPRSYVVADDASIVAPAAWEGVAPGDLSFRKGDVLLLRFGMLPARGYWLARLGRRRGIVPRWLLDPAWFPQAHLYAALIAAAYRGHRLRRIGQLGPDKGSKLTESSYHAFSTLLENGRDTSDLRNLQSPTLSAHSTPAATPGGTPSGTPLGMPRGAPGALAGTPRGASGNHRRRMGQEAAARKACVGLGINLKEDPDLAWIGSRALAAKPPLPDAETANRYTNLAVLATYPSWAADAAGATHLMRNGWYTYI